MATTKTLTPTSQTITIDDFQGEKPDHRHVADAEGKLADAINALNPKKNSVSSLSSDTEILTWNPGAYMIALNANSEYIPARYGTLVIAHGSGNYGVATFTSTTGNFYFRHMNGTTGWHTGWTQVALNSQLNPVTVKQYSATTETNANVSPWGAYTQISIPAEERNTYGSIFSVTTHSASTNPSMGAITSGEGGIMIYSKSAATFNVSVAFIKNRTT